MIMTDQHDKLCGTQEQQLNYCNARCTVAADLTSLVLPDQLIAFNPSCALSKPQSTQLQLTGWAYYLHNHATD